MQKYSKDDVYIVADDIRIGERVTFGRNIDILINGIFQIGDDSHLGSDCNIRGNNITIGKDFYNSGGLKVGGGGRETPWANLYIGDRNTNHNNFINVARSVVLGNDVGLSPEVSILTHGAWLSVLDGFPVQYAPVAVKSKTIIGYRSTIMPGVTIGPSSVVGACSLVTKNLAGYAIYGGVPAKKIGNLKMNFPAEKKEIMVNITQEYTEIAQSYGYDVQVETNYPVIKFEGCVFDVDSMTIIGVENNLTDTFRGHLRRYGIRFYTNRPFRNFGEILVKQ